MLNHFLGSAAAPWESDPNDAPTLSALVEVHAFLKVWLRGVISPDHAPQSPFLNVGAAHARRRAVRPDRCAATRSATRLGLICLARRRKRGTMPRRSSAGWREAERDGAEQRSLRITGRQLDADAREMLDHARADLDQTLADGRELGLCERVCLRNGVAYGEHQPIRGGVESEPNLIGRRAVTRHAVRRQLCLVQLDQVLHLPALAVDVLIKIMRRSL